RRRDYRRLVLSFLWRPAAGTDHCPPIEHNGPIQHGNSDCSRWDALMLTGRDIVCLSTQDWNGLWTRKQRFMKMFAENGNRVLYIETPVHLFGVDVLPKDPLRFFRFMSGPRPIGDRLFVATLPILLPMFQ